MSSSPPPSPPVATNDVAISQTSALTNDTVDDLDQYDSDTEEYKMQSMETVPSHFDLVSSLYKRRGGFGRNADINWVKRCFTLCGPVLCYYDSPDVESFDPSKPRGRLNLAKEDTIAEMHEKQKSGSPTEFLVTVNIYGLGGKRKWGLCCKDKEQQLQWYNAIKQFDGKTEKDSGVDYVSESQVGPKFGKNRKKKSKTSGQKMHQSPLGSKVQDKASPTEIHAYSTPLSEDEVVSSELLADVETEYDLETLASFVTLNVAAYFMRYGNVHVYWISIIVSNLVVVNLLKREASKRKTRSLSRNPSLRSSIRGTPPPKLKAPRAVRQSFLRARPAGSTHTRAAPEAGSVVADVVKEHGPMSMQAIRAYASSPTGYDKSQKNAHWNVDASKFSLRIGPNYKKNRLKAPSGPALYDLISMDFVQAESVLKNASTGFTMPVIPGITDIKTGHPHVPPMIVINTWLPLSDHGVFGKVVDGPSIVNVQYFAITEQTLKELEDIENASPAVKLLAEWCRVAEADDEFRSRFKAIGTVVDIEKTNIPSVIAQYNSKPALVTKSGTFTRHENYIEMSVNVHMWGYLARKGLVALTPKFPNFVLDIGFTIEAKKDHELPEVLLGGCRLINVDPEQVPRDNGEMTG